MVNRAITTVLHGADPAAWDHLLDQFSERDAFQGAEGENKARQVLQVFGDGVATQIIHGHMPISHQSGQRPEEVSAPLVNAGGRCVNVDGGMYLGGPGFVHRL
jgi:hypothetical protein